MHLLTHKQYIEKLKDKLISENKFSTIIDIKILVKESLVVLVNLITKHSKASRAYVQFEEHLVLHLAKLLLVL